MINHLKKICEKLGVETIEEAVEMANKKDPNLNLNATELESLQEEINVLCKTIQTNQNAFNVKNLRINAEEESED